MVHLEGWVRKVIYKKSRLKFTQPIETVRNTHLVSITVREATTMPDIERYEKDLNEALKTFCKVTYIGLDGEKPREGLITLVRKARVIRRGVRG